MNEAQLRKISKMAKDFSKHAKDLATDLSRDRFHNDPVLAGAVRRKSLDLTRALAELRDPNRLGNRIYLPD